MPETFFQQKEVRALRRRENGAVLILIYIKMQLFSLKMGGVLFFDGYEDSFAEELAFQIDEDPEDVQKLIDFLKKHGLLVEKSDNEIYLPAVTENTGTEGSSAERVRNYRKKKGLLQCNTACGDSALQCNTQTSQCDDSSLLCHGEKELDIELEKEKEIEKEKEKEYTPPLGAGNTPEQSSAAVPSLPSVENSVDKDGEPEMIIRYFLNMYKFYIGRDHEPIGADKREEIKKRLKEYGATRAYVNEYFGDDGTESGKKPVYGESDGKIFHFASPGVLELLAKRVHKATAGTQAKPTPKKKTGIWNTGIDPNYNPPPGVDPTWDYYKERGGYDIPASHPETKKRLEGQDENGFRVYEV